MENKKTILIAEDEEDLREMYVTALLRAGFDVIEAKNGKEALVLLNKNHARIRMVLLDIVMPEMDGFETLEKMRKNPNLQDLPVIISTNLDNEEDQKYAVSLGVKEYFVKSRHTPTELVELVRLKIDECDMSEQ